MTLMMRLQSHLNRNINYLNRFKLRRFATGLAFGGLLTFFAFGSMGMQSSHEDGKLASNYFKAQEFKFTADFAVKFEEDLARICAQRGRDASISSDDMHQIVDLLIKYLKPVARKLNKSRLPADSSVDYTRILHNFSQSGEATRGSGAMLLFNFLSDFLEFSYRDFPQESSYNDIPRFHFMCVPVVALKNLGIDLARSQEDFGITESISLEQFCQAARTIVSNAEIRLNRNL
ncbi:MAG TPA: hypothetical protein PLM07_01630 [Candidatus Rifleibacterium sp.]|nr:hypothetical protein [Candidatus Rifleibacterium sp.]HPT44579.1 hypothetical protein [Candidatus Rifleibacterium sp.]